MKTQILTFLFFPLPFFLTAQNNQVETGNIPVAATDGAGYQSMFSNLVSKKPINYNGIVGTPYLHEDWQKGKVYVLDKEVVFDEMKINVLNNELEVKVKNSEKILESRYLTYFDLIINDATTQHFVNGDQYTYEGRPLTGFVKETLVGDFTILTRYKARWVKPDQTDKITGGDPRDKIVQSKENYVLWGKKLVQIRNKKDVLELLRRKEKKIKAYMKENKTDVKDENELAGVLAHYLA